MKNIIQRVLIFPLLFLSQILCADNERPEMADVMHSNGKIYVVVAVVLVILLGLFVYLYVADRRIKKLEEEIN